MKVFPDESKMEKSKDGSEPIRGGSIGLNRILNFFVSNQNDRSPKFTTIFVSAFTVVRNVLGTDKNISMKELEERFVKDLQLLYEYYDIYIALTKSHYTLNQKALMIVYFPEYKNIPKSILKEPGDGKSVYQVYLNFLARHRNRDELIWDSPNLACFWIGTEGSTYPHQSLARKFKDLSNNELVMHVTGSQIALISHVDLDFHILYRLQNVCILESYTGRVKTKKDLRFRLDKEGRIPFNSTTHVVFGDSSLIKPWITPKMKRMLLDKAKEENWILKSESEVARLISKVAEIPMSELRKFDFI